MACNEDFKFWCQTVLPIVYDDSLSYYEQLCKLSEYLNITVDELDKLAEQVDTNTLGIESANSKSNEALRIAWLAYNITQQFDINKAYVDKQDTETLNKANNYSDSNSVRNAFAICYDKAEALTSKPNKWYIPKELPKPIVKNGITIDVLWKNGSVNGLGYNVQLIWGKPDSADNEVIIDSINTANKLTGSYNIPTESTVRYVLTESSGRKHWEYVSGKLISTQFSTDTAADASEKLVPGMSLEYIPGMEIYVQLDKGNTAKLMNLKDDNGISLPVYGNGTGTDTGAISAGYILHLVNAGDHWQIINGKADISSLAPIIRDTLSGSAVATDMVSPVEHPVECKVESINLADATKATTVWGTLTTDAATNKVVFSGTYYFRIPLTVPAGSTVYFRSVTSQNPLWRLEYTDGTLADSVRIGTPIKAVKDVKAVYIYKGGNIESYEANMVYDKIIVSTSNAEYAPYVPDLSKVTVTRCAGNMLNPSWLFAPGNGNWSMKTKAQGGTVFFKAKAGDTYYIRNNFKSRVTEFKNFETGDSIVRAPLNSEQFSYTFETDTNFIVHTWNSSTPELSTARLWLSKGEDMPNYEPYNGTNYTPTPDGSVNGMASLSPNMTILSDNAGVNIEATYNADTKKYIDKKFEALNNAVLSMGGNI